MLAWVLVIIISFFLSFSSAAGQRVFGAVDPSSAGADLRFDTNDLPLRGVPLGSGAPADLNFSPNVVSLCSREPETGACVPGSLKAFVSYPGSDQVLVFDPATGEILQMIDVDPNPALITPTPDGKKVGVVSIFIKDNLPQIEEGGFQGKQIGSISIIDVETFEIKKLELTEVWFSFANNVVFSEDGKTGFIASAGTDQIIRFDVETATEIGPRLSVPAATRPASITMAPNYRFFGVILIGSTNLSQLEQPDSIRLIDVESFSEIRSIVPTREENQFPHDFMAVNRMAISADSRFGLVGDRENSRLSNIPPFATDHAILLDLETGETVKIFPVAGVAGGSHAVPGRNRFVTISELSVELIDVESQESFRITPSRSDFQPTTRAAFSSDGSRMFVAAPLDDLLQVIDLDRRVTLRSLEIGPAVERVIDGVTVTLAAAPLDVAFTPDGNVLSVVKFNANSIGLLRPRTESFFIPRILSDDEWFTGIAVTNNSEGESELIAFGRDRVGIRFQDLQDTEDVVEFVNPKTLRLAPGRQESTVDGAGFACFPCTAAELLEAAPGSNPNGWLDFDSDRFGISSFFLIGDRQLNRLDGGVAVFGTQEESLLPEVRVTGGFNTEINILNPNLNSADAIITLFNSAGEELDQLTRSLPPLTMLIGLLRGDLFGEDTFRDFANGYITVEASEGLISWERYFDAAGMAALNGFPISGPGTASSTRLYLPQVVAFGGTETFVNLVYRGAESVTVELILKDNAGNSLFSTHLEMAAGQAIRTTLPELFPLSPEGGLFEGWLLIDSGDVVGLFATAEVQLSSGRAISAIAAHGSGLKDFVFSHVAQAMGVSTGLALVNPAETPAEVQAQVFTPEGTLAGSTNLSIGPSEREIGLLTEFFPGVTGMHGGYIRVSSDQEIVGLELFFADNLEYLAAVPAQPLSE